MEAFLVWLNGDRRNRDMQLQLDPILSKVRLSFSHLIQGRSELSKAVNFESFEIRTCLAVFSLWLHFLASVSHPSH